MVIQRAHYFINGIHARLTRHLRNNNLLRIEQLVADVLLGSAQPVLIIDDPVRGQCPIAIAVHQGGAHLLERLLLRSSALHVTV